MVDKIRCFKIVFESGVQDLILPENYNLGGFLDLIGDIQEIIEIEIFHLTEEELSNLPEWNP